MSMIRLIELKKIVEESKDLSEMTPLELVVWGAILEDGEIPVKNFHAKTLDNTGLGILIEGQLLLTNTRVLFIIDEEGGSYSIKYKDMDEFYSGFNQRDKTEGLLIIVSEGAFYSFSGLNRFGLKRWEEYVNNKIDSRI